MTCRAVLRGLNVIEVNEFEALSGIELLLLVVGEVRDLRDRPQVLHWVSVTLQAPSH